VAYTSSQQPQQQLWRCWERIFSFRGKVGHKVYGANNTNKTHKHFRWISPSNAVILMAGAFNHVATAAAAVVGLFAAYFLRVGDNGR
jgi:hypothetical protein